MKNITMNFLMVMVMILISIAFFTLMERKLIGYKQNRKGPNKTSMIGMIQPMADAIKLINKEINMNAKSNFYMFTISPIMNIMCSLIMWFAMPMTYTFKFMKMSMLFIMAAMATNMIIMMTMSWSSSSNYALISMMRMISQLISYEINFMMMMILYMNMSEQMNLEMSINNMKWYPMIMISPIIMTAWMIIMLAETNRSPFDFSEGESELISGFNIEFSGSSFMFMFLAEYSSILMMSMITTIMFYSKEFNSSMFMTSYMVTCFMFIWTRASLPRFRYDKLMKLNWHKMLPLTMIGLYISFMIKPILYTKKLKQQD